MNALSFLRSAPSSRSASPARPDSGVPDGNGSPVDPARKKILAPFRRPSPAPPANPPTPIIQDGSYMETLALQLSEGVRKALAAPSGPITTHDLIVKGRKPIPAGRGKALGDLIAAELNASGTNWNLQRAIIRVLHRPLSVLLTNLSSHLLPLLPVIVSSPAAQAHAVALSCFAAEVLETFDAFSLGLDSRDGLKEIRAGLENVITRVTTPIVDNIKGELTTVLETLGSASTKKHPHPALTTLGQALPQHSKMLARLNTPTSLPAQSALASLLISIIFRSMVALAYRSTSPVPLSSTTPPLTPPLLKKRLIPTPPNTPPASRFSIKLPREGSVPSRPSTPPNDTLAVLALDAAAVLDLIGTLPRPAPGSLPAEAVDDAFERFKAFADWLRTLVTKPGGGQVPEQLPTLLALPIKLHGTGLTVHALLGMTEQEFKERCLTGFGRAEQCEEGACRLVLESLADVEGHDDLKKWLVEEMQG